VSAPRPPRRTDRSARFPEPRRIPDLLTVSSSSATDIADAYRDTRFQPAVDLRSGYRTRSILCVPVVNKQSQRLEGIISFWNVLEKLLGESH